MDAQRWLRYARRVAGHTLATEVPTLDALLTARAIDMDAGYAARDVAEGKGEADTAREIVRRERALRTFYQAQVWPEVLAARDRRIAADNEAYRLPRLGGARDRALREVAHVMEAQDAKLASVLLRRYAVARAQILSASDLAWPGAGLAMA